jgi:hypothetical protein
MEASDLYLLQNVPPYHLQAVARARHLPLAQKNSLDTLSPAEIGEALFDLDACRAVIGELGELETRILRELVACGGRANSRDLALYFTYAQLLGQSKDKPPTDKVTTSGALSTPHPGSTELPGDAARHKREPGAHLQTTPSLRPYAEAANSNALQYPPPHPHGIFEQALHRLLLLGLLYWGKQTNFVGRDYSNGVYDGVLIVPHAVMEAVSTVLSERPESSLPGEASESSSQALISEGVLALQRALYLYWSLVFSSRDGLPLVGSKLLSRPALRQVIEQVDPTLNTEVVRTEADAPRLLFLRLLLMKLELIYERNGALFAAPAETYFALPLVERARSCYRLWLETPFWNELGYLPGVILRPGPGPLDPAHPEVLHARAMVMERVEEQSLQTTGEWQSFSTFIARAKLYVPYLLFPRQYGARAERYSTDSNPYGWDFRLRHGWLTHREGWHQVEGGFIRAMLSGPLRWLGLVEVKEEDRPDTFRIIPHISDIINDDVLPPADVVWGKLVVQPNFELIVLVPVSEALLVNLDRFAERARLEQIAQYRLTKASVTRAVQMGLRAETIQQQLEQAAGGSAAIPQNISYSLVEWERQARRIELWPRVTLLEVDEAPLLDELFADEQTRPLFGRRVAPLLAEVKAERMDELQTLLWQREYMPALVSAPLYNDLLASGQMPAHEAQWKLLPDGLLQPCYPVVNLYLAAELDRISERDEETSWRRITAASIAASQHIPLEHTVRFLQRYCQDGVPPSFLIRLKLWGGGYDRQHVIQVEDAPMLRLSASALRDIQADEELGALLEAEIPPASRLVRVSPERLARVLELLRERGFVVEEK